ncbi:MAG: tetratricopeptide repeat protein [Rhodocyclaceae bacterium]|nr:tetratricopeptide repeat protein [Rhodocyclaceae bacterium]
MHAVRRSIIVTALLAGVLGTTVVRAEKADQAPAEAAVGDSSLSAETLYLFLLGEIAGARGHLDVSVRAYLQLARSTRDPRVAKRAAEIALFARDMGAAAEAARLWNEIDPDSAEAQRVLTGVLMRTGARIEELEAHLAKALAGAGVRLPQHLLGLNGAMARVENKQAAREVIDRVTEPYLTQPEAHFARAHAAFNANDTAGAQGHLDRALERRPDWEPAVMMKAQLLQHERPDEAIALLGDYAARHPDSHQAKLALARSLAAVKRYKDARDAFDAVLESSPDDSDALNSSALLSMQIEDWPAAERRLHELLRANPDNGDRIRLLLGQVAAARDNDTLAEQYYRAVGSGDEQIQAQFLLARLQSKHGEYDLARQTLHAIEGDEDVLRRARVAEAQVLRDAERYQEAYDLLDEELQRSERDPDLLYETALLAERLGRTDVMEGRLRMLLDVNPDNAHALNALGYSFADRGVRLDEAYSLIKRANELAPEDPFILDSLGWVHFRKGEHGRALELLRQAYDQRSDPEIAAHVGEVLWAMDRRDEARRIWSEASERHPDSKELKEVIGRYAQ